MPWGQLFIRSRLRNSRPAAPSANSLTMRDSVGKQGTSNTNRRTEVEIHFIRNCFPGAVRRVVRSTACQRPVPRSNPFARKAGGGSRFAHDAGGEGAADAEQRSRP